jgi:PAS domain-containing protein
LAPRRDLVGKAAAQNRVQCMAPATPVPRLSFEVVWLLSRGQAKDTHSSRVIGVSFDITERKPTESALRESKARLQAAVDLVGLGCYACNPQTNALECDARLKAMWGLPADAPVDYDVWRAGVHRDDLAVSKRQSSGVSTRRAMVCSIPNTG